MHKQILPIALLAIAVIAAVIAGCTGTPPDNDIPDPDRTYYIVGIDEFYPPHTYLDEKGKPAGFDVESMIWIAQDQGLDIRFKTREWKGIISALLDKKIDILCSGLSITPERAEIISFSDPYWAINQGIAVKKDSPVTMEKVMSGSAVTGTLKESTAADWIKRYLVGIGVLKKDRFKPYDDFQSGLTALEEGQIEAFIYDAPGLIEAIEDRNLEYLGSIKTGEKYGIAVRKEDKELLEKLNTGLKHLTESPKWAELIAKYELNENN
ncbi:MAG: amino acid ABC transporter substrate-binding protein [Methanomicrobium sp.]|nr:amino acid ABC transporter substrate-binding protein [Methanomicrobium sp.]